MTAYTVKFQNDTQSTWTLVVTATLPSGGGLESVAFQQVRSPATGRGTIRFDDSLSVVLGTYLGTGSTRVYDTTLNQPATAGSAWKVVSEGAVQQFAPNGNAAFPNQVDVLNASTALANIGLGIGATGAVFQPNVRVNGKVPFVLPQAYWATLSSDSVQPGQVMSSSVTTFVLAVLTSPVAILLSAATPAATVIATEPGPQVVVAVTYP